MDLSHDQHVATFDVPKLNAREVAHAECTEDTSTSAFDGMLRWLRRIEDMERVQRAAIEATAR